MISRRGLTLVELLLSLALLASLSVVGIDWAVTATRLSSTAGDTARWNAAAHVTLECLADDLASGDFDVESRRDRARLWVEGDRLSVLSRDGGTSRVVYEWDSSTNTMRRRSAGNSDPNRLLLGEVAGFECDTEPVLDPDNPEAEPTSVVLTIMIARDEEHRVTREFLVPTEWLP